MIVYLFILVLCFLGSVLYSKRCVIINTTSNKKHYIQISQIWFVIISLLLILLVGFRDYSVGIDTMNYYQEYMKYSSANFSILKSYSWFDEVGNKLIVLLCNKLGLSFSIYSLLMASIYMIPLFFLIKKTKINHFFALLLFVLSGMWFYSMSTVRQAAAIGITVIAFLVKKNKILSIILVLVASTIHVSALMFLLFIIVDFIPLTQKNLWIWGSVGAIILIFGISSLRIYMFQIIESANRTYTVTQTPAGMLQAVFFISTLLLMSWFIKNFSTDGVDSYMKLFYLAAIILPIVSINSTLFRVYQYFSIYQIVLVPYFLKNIKDKEIRTFGYVGYLSVYAYLFMNSLNTTMKLLPYSIVK